MSDRGDNDFQPHPGDPWHPTWDSAYAVDRPVDAPEADESDPDGSASGKTKRAKRGRLGRRRKDSPAEAASDVEEESIDDPTRGEVDFDLPAAPVAEPPTEDRAPLPAWLAESGPDSPAAPALEVELPSWVGGATAGADDAGGEFPDQVFDDQDEGDDELDDGISAPAAVEASDEIASVPPREVPDDLAAVLDALGDDGDEIEVLAVEAFEVEAEEEDPEELPDLESLVGAVGGFQDPSPEDAAARSEYGVAGRDAFDALKDPDGSDDLGDWHQFAGATGDESETLPIEVVVDPPVPEPREGGKRGRWFRRKVEEADESEVVAEEAADWADDGTAIPAGWFAEIDEDTVVTPPVEPPDTEYPEPDEIVAVAPTDLGSDEVEELPVALAPGDWSDEVEELPAAPVAGDWSDEGEELPVVPVAPLDWSVEGEVLRSNLPAAPQPGLFDDRHATEEFDPIAAGIGGVAPDISATPDWEDDRAGEAPVAQGLAPLGFDDGESAGHDEELTSDEDDEGYEDRWVTGPIDLGGEYLGAADDSGAYESIDELDDATYRTSSTTEHRGLAEEIALTGDEEHEWQAMAAAMPGVESGVVGFEDVADLGDDEEYLDTRVRSDLGTRILTGVVLGGFFLGSLWVAPEALAGFIAIILLLGLGEFFATVRRRGWRPLALFGFLGAISMLATTWFHGPIAVAATLAMTTVVTFFVFAFSPLRRDALTNGGLTVLGLAWVVGTAAFVYPILANEDYRVLVIAIVVVTAAMDIGAYAVGRAWGVRALAPVLSPNKSVEGLVGGIGLCMLAAAAVGNFLEPFDLLSGIGLGIVVVFAAPLGDLAESMFKRSLGVKDMGSILPGHGGILDRVDALLFVIPAAWAFYQTVGFLG
ncbi:MAG: phosphatidate cytidylyltransferase [Acidimicrobiia bacterium]